MGRLLRLVPAAACMITVGNLNASVRQVRAF